MLQRQRGQASMLCRGANKLSSASMWLMLPVAAVVVVRNAVKRIGYVRVVHGTTEAIERAVLISCDDLDNARHSKG